MEQVLLLLGQLARRDAAWSMLRQLSPAAGADCRHPLWAASHAAFLPHCMLSARSRGYLCENMRHERQWAHSTDPSAARSLETLL